MSADEILFRCSSLGFLMTSGNGELTEIQKLRITELSCKPKLTEKQELELGKLVYKRNHPELSETTKTHLVDVFVTEKYGRHTEIHGKQLDKGNDTEEDSITVISRITKQFFKKNEEQLRNKWIKGTPDLFKGEVIRKAKQVRDAKSSWDIFTFNRAISKALDPRYKWQGTGYMWLTGADVCYIDYCLNNTPYQLIDRELRLESYKHPEGATPNWIEAQIIANHTYDRKTFEEYIQRRGLSIAGDENCMAIFHGFVEVPIEERHFAFTIERNENDILKLQERIEDARSWMNEHLFKSNLLPA